MSQPPQQPRDVRGRRSLADRRRGERRVLVVGLLLSLAVHLLALAVFSDLLDRDASPAPPPRPTTVVLEPPSGMRVVEVTPIEGAAAPGEPEPDEPDEREDPAPVVVAGPEPTDSLPADDVTAADRLAPRVVDARLWRPMILVPREPTIEDVEARIAAAVEMLSDSALAEAEAAINARDWTVEDEEGGRWGISPGQLHLGSVTLPLPIWFPVDPEVEAAEREWYQMEGQLERTRILESFEERVRAIRERRERERAESQGGEPAENGGG